MEAWVESSTACSKTPATWGQSWEENPGALCPGPLLSSDP